MVPFGRNGSYEVTFDKPLRGVIQRDGNVAGFRYFGHSTDRIRHSSELHHLRNGVHQLLCSFCALRCGRRIMK